MNENDVKTITVEINGKEREKPAYALSFVRQYVREQIARQPIIGRQNIYDSSYALLNVDVEQSWGVNCRIAFKLNKSWAVQQKDYITYDGVEVSWSSTGRDIPNATASIALYTQMTNLAAQLDCILRDWGYFFDDKA